MLSSTSRSILRTGMKIYTFKKHINVCVQLVRKKKIELEMAVSRVSPTDMLDISIIIF